MIALLLERLALLLLLQLVALLILLQLLVALLIEALAALLSIVPRHVLPLARALLDHVARAA